LEKSSEVNLSKLLEKSIKNHDNMKISYKNIFHDESNGVEFGLYILTNSPKNLVKLYVV
jgi:hypothetical protein